MPSQLVNAVSARTVQPLQSLLFHGLDAHAPDVRGAGGFEQGSHLGMTL
jgi:hypothetical protein